MLSHFLIRWKAIQGTAEIFSKYKQIDKNCETASYQVLREIKHKVIKII